MNKSSRARHAASVQDLTPPDDVECLLFDWDGTLADSTAANAAAFDAALAPSGGAVDLAWFTAHAGLSTEDALAAVVAEQDLSVDVAAFTAARDAEYAARIGTVQVVPAVAALARAQAGRRRLAVVSGGRAAGVLGTLAHLGLAPLFEVVVTREDAPSGKPAPDLYRVALERLGVAPGRAWAYEDSDEGIAAAVAAGITAVDVRPLVRPHLAAAGGS